MSVDDHFERYHDLQAYVGWTDEDAARVAAAAAFFEPHLKDVVDDFYDAVERNHATSAVIASSATTVDRLKLTLLDWLGDLFSGNYDRAYVERRWQVGRRHVDLALDQVYTNAALSRIRGKLLRLLHAQWPGDREEMNATGRSLNKLLDLDLAIIEDAYQAEYYQRQQRIERLATIGQVAGGVAHELRNPLNVVKTSVYYLLNARNTTPEKVDEHLRRVERHVEIADGVITALSSFARMPSPNAQALALEPSLREALEVNPTPDSITVEVDLPESLPPVSADGRQLQIVFGNLIRNACDAMPGGGRLTITGRPIEEPPGVEVTVADTGVGIAPDNLVRILEPLFTTKARGLGLGLALVRTILEKNQGTLRVVSELGHGSAFTVRLAAALTDPASERNGP